MNLGRNFQNTWKYITIGCYVATAIIISGTGYYLGKFLYDNTYRLEHGDTNYIIKKKNYTIENLDKARFDKVIKGIEEKKSIPKPDQVKNIF